MTHECCGHLFQIMVFGNLLPRGDLQKKRIMIKIQKLTELGVSSITPIQSERSEIKIRPKDQSKKIEHWGKIAISACQQCDRDEPPKIHGIGNFSRTVTTRSENVIVLGFLVRSYYFTAQFF